MKYRTFPAATCGPKMASTIPGKACIRYLFDCANIEQNAATINMIVDRPTDSPVVMRQILPTASVLKSTMVKIADILSAHPNPRTSGPSDLQGTQALKSCNRRAIVAANSLNRKRCPSAEFSLPRNRYRPCNRRAIVRGV